VEMKREAWFVVWADDGWPCGTVVCGGGGSLSFLGFSNGLGG